MAWAIINQKYVTTNFAKILDTTKRRNIQCNSEVVITTIP